MFSTNPWSELIVSKLQKLPSKIVNKLLSRFEDINHVQTEFLRSRMHTPSKWNSVGKNKDEKAAPRSSNKCFPEPSIYLAWDIGNTLLATWLNVFTFSKYFEFSWRHQFPNMWGYGSWNNWEKEEGSTKEIMGRVRKEGFGKIWPEKRGCVRSEGMARAN